MEKSVARSAPELYKAVKEANDDNFKNPLPVYQYPNEVVTATMIAKFSKYGISFEIGDAEASEKIGMLESQKESGKGIFGGGYFISRESGSRESGSNCLGIK
jgi:hypothetical protein